MQAPALTATDWLDAGLDALKEAGYPALKALPLAKRLGVTRGSFYHHFDSLDAYHSALVAHWSTRTSAGLIDAAATATDPAAALDRLLQVTLTSAEGLERAIRAWAIVQPSVAEAVERIDAGRIGAAEDLLLRAGVGQAEATARARLLYWAAIGRLMMPVPARAVLSPEEITDIATLMRRT